MEAPQAGIPGNLLVYLPEFSIVICKVCRFAIQPKAISSHLLRHHIYRNNRRQILEYVSQLKLLEPHEVAVPLPGTLSLLHLPVFSGYKCNFQACYHLCISQKRMIQHLKDQHGENASLHMDVLPVQLQTFFRGNKNRYFEVRSDGHSVADSLSRQPTSLENSDPGLHNNQPTPISFSETGNIDRAGTAQLAMQDLMYLHRYVTSTGHTVTRGNESVQFWTHTLPQQASTQPYLMHGILGVAAFHQAFLSSLPKERRVHQQAGLLHQSAGLISFRVAMDHPSTQNCTALIAFARLLGIQSCAQALLVVDTSWIGDGSNGESNIAPVLEFLLLMRGGCELLLTMQDLLPIDSEFILSAAIRQGLDDLSPHQSVLSGATPYIIHEAYNLLDSRIPHLSNYGDLQEAQQISRLCEEASKIPWDHPITQDWTEQRISNTSLSTLDVQYLVHCLNESRKKAETAYNRAQLEQTPAPLPPASCYPNVSPDLYSHLSSLPQRLAVKVAIYSPLELEACVQAVAALLSSFSRSCAAHRIWAIWNGIESWPRMLSDRFLGMIDAGHPFALVLAAHWCTLIKRQEEFYWFLGGQSERLMGIILANLDTESQDMVQGCLAALRQAEA